MAAIRADDIFIFFYLLKMVDSIIGSDNGLAPSRWQAIIWTNDGIVYWRIYASLGLNELKNEIYG